MAVGGSGGINRPAGFLGICTIKTCRARAHCEGVHSHIDLRTDNLVKARLWGLSARLIAIGDSRARDMADIVEWGTEKPARFRFLLETQHRALAHWAGFTPISQPGADTTL